MVDYDTAYQVVQDPNADPVMLARIAYENPEFGPNVAYNPRCYPGLKHWLATFGTKETKDYLAQMDPSLVDEHGPVADQPAEGVQAADQASQDQAATGAAGAAYEQVSYEQPDYVAPVQEGPAQAAAQPAQQAQTGVQPAQNPAQYAQATAQPVQTAPVQTQTAAQPIQAAAAPQFTPPEQIQATNPYGFTAQQALDPNTDPATLQQIAQYAPELLPCLAKNPNTYPALLDWLRGLNDPAINAALASRA